MKVHPSDEWSGLVFRQTTDAGCGTEGDEGTWSLSLRNEILDLPQQLGYTLHALSENKEAQFTNGLHAKQRASTEVQVAAWEVAEHMHSIPFSHNKLNLL